MTGNTRYSEKGPENTISAGQTAIELVRAYRIREVCRVTGLGRTTIYQAIKSRSLIARRFGRCTIVLAEDLKEFLRNLPAK